MNSDKIRCFIALELPEAIKFIAQSTQNEIKKRNLVDARFSSMDSMHLTLKFLGEVEEKTVKDVASRLRKIRFPAFTVRLVETGTFEQEGETKIIWHALGGDELHKLQQTIDETLQDLFIPERRFMAHITIARAKKDIDQRKLLQFLKTIKESDKKFSINSFSLIKSTLTKDGPVYETIEEFRLVQ